MSTHITSAIWHDAGSTLKTPMGPPMTLPAHCEVVGVLRERAGAAAQSYAIRFKMRLPEAWNQRFFFQGGGGTNGELGDAVGLVSPGAPGALTLGYAVVSQDSGHDNARNSVPEQGGAVAFGFDPQARADYGGASLAPVAAAAKTLIRTYYGRAPERSYFVGCSKGGQEGMALAQRYPDVFDGIVAGAPGFSLPRAAVAEAWDTQAFASLIEAGKSSDKIDPARLPKTFSNAQFARVRKAVLEACDADDGAVDGITANWTACDWPRVKVKLKGQVCSNAADCLSNAQVEVLGRVMSGAKDRKGGALYASWPLDGGVGSDGWRNDTVAWYREVDQRNRGRAAQFVRVFPVPGMAHCAGGPATDQFNAFDALVAWVERGKPPDSILAKAGPGSPWPGRSRPLCPYPQVARYSGSGSVEDAASFRCK